jgi:hypothetical protein
LQAQVIATTVPNPLDTAYFTTPEAAAGLYGLTPAALRSALQLNAGDLLTRDALTTAGLQFAAGKTGALPKGSVLDAAVAAQITARVAAINAQIVTAARANGAALYDLNDYLHRIRLTGAAAGARVVTADYLGGFYSLDGVYPGLTGHALIANDVLTLLNRTYGTSFAAVDVGTVAASDPALAHVRIPSGRVSQ